MDNKFDKKKTKALIVDAAHLFKDKEGNYFAPTIYDNAFLARYLEVFDTIKFMGKVREMQETDESRYIKIDTPKVEICELPWYQGLKQLFIKLPLVIKACSTATKECDCYILRALQIESILVYFLRDKKVPYAVEVVNDPESWEEFSGIVRKILSILLRRIVNGANGVSYVTQEVLQKKYPCRASIYRKDDNNYFESYYSSVELRKEEIQVPKKYNNTMDEINIVHVANNIVGEGKGHYTLIQIINKLVEKGINAKVSFIGEGTEIDSLKQCARELGVIEQINFEGRIANRTELLEKIKEYDIMVFPTHTEGLPRCIIEACAVGLPCLATSVGGIPELLNAEFLFDPNDVEGFTSKLLDLFYHPEQMSEMSRQNIETAFNYQKEILDARRKEFYTKLRNIVIE